MGTLSDQKNLERKKLKAIEEVAELYSSISNNSSQIIKDLIEILDATISKDEYKIFGYGIYKVIQVDTKLGNSITISVEQEGFVYNQTPLM